jgi:GINS complex subunit 4
MYIIHAQLDDRLSVKEREYAHAYCDLLGEHLHNAFLAQLPESLQSLADQNMVVRPNIDQHVFIRVTSHVGDFQLDDAGVEAVSLELGDTYVVRYRTVQQLLREKRVELI